MIAMGKVNTLKRNHLLWLALVLGIGLPMAGLNPFERFIEAPPSAYYQARIAVERGGPGIQARIVEVLCHGKITLHDYSKVVFPAFADLKLDTAGQSPFPDAEKAKSAEQVKVEAMAAVRGMPCTTER